MDNNNPISQQPQSWQNQQIVVNNTLENRGNGLGTAGFVLALLGVLLFWVPGLDWLLWVLGLIFSFIGVFKAPRGLAIAGLVLSFIDLIILFVAVSAIASLF